MNKRKYLFVFLALVFVSVSAQNPSNGQPPVLVEIQPVDARLTDPSQPRFNFGISANVGSNYHHYTAGAVDGKTTTSFGFGLMSQVNFGMWAIRPEVHYDRIRGQHPDGLIATNNITVPLSLVFQAIDYSMGFGAGADIFIGGFYSHRFSGTQSDHPINFNGGIEVSPDPVEPRLPFYQDEFGITWGFGLRIGQVRLGYTNRTALTNFTQQRNDVGAHIRNRTNYFTLTYIF